MAIKILPSVIAKFMTQIVTRNPSLGAWLAADGTRRKPGPHLTRVMLAMHRVLLELTFPERDTTPGMSIPLQQGDNVVQIFPGLGGMPARVQGVVSGKRVKVTDGAVNRSWLPLEGFTLIDDPFWDLRDGLSAFWDAESAADEERKTVVNEQKMEQFDTILSDVGAGSVALVLDSPGSEPIPMLVIGRISEDRMITYPIDDVDYFDPDKVDASQNYWDLSPSLPAKVLDLEVPFRIIGRYQNEIWRSFLDSEANLSPEDRDLKRIMAKPETWAVARLYDSERYADNLKFYDKLQVKHEVRKNPQQMSSAGTAIPQRPAIFAKVPWRKGTVNLDIGGGPFHHTTDYLRGRGVENLVYDPFNRAVTHNRAVLNRVRLRPADTVTLANTLNVIDARDAQEQAVMLAASSVQPTGTVMIQIYEGDKSSKGRYSGGNRYQANMPTNAYIPMVRKHFRQVEQHGNTIYARIPLRVGRNR